MNNLAIALLERQKLIEDKLDIYGAILNKAEKGAMGLTLDTAKTPEWKEAKQQHAIWFKLYRECNSALNKQRKHVGYECVNGKRVSIFKYKD